jgi:hypothetical protein
LAQLSFVVTDHMTQPQPSIPASQQRPSRYLNHTNNTARNHSIRKLDQTSTTLVAAAFIHNLHHHCHLNHHPVAYGLFSTFARDRDSVVSAFLASFASSL